MKRIHRKLAGFFRLNWYVIAVVFILSASALLLLFRNTDPKSPKIKPSTSGDFVFEAKNQIYSAKIGAHNSSEPLVSFTSKAGGNVSFQFDGASEATIEEKNNTVLFRNVDPNTDISYTPLPNGIKEEIIINNPVSQAEYNFNIITQNASPRKNIDGSFSRYFFNDSGIYQFHIEKPFAVDARGARTEQVQFRIRESKENENQYQILVSLPQEWLSSKDRSYPISIDPTFTYTSFSGFMTGDVLNRVIHETNQTNLHTPYQPVVADKYTVAMWHMDEASGNIIDSSGNGGTGTPTGTTVNTTTHLMGTASRILNGTSDYITVPDSDKLDPAEITIEAWIKPNIIQTGNFVNKGDNAGYRFRVRSTGAVQLLNRGATNIITSNTILESGKWYHVAVSGNSSGMKVYVNGKLDASTSMPYESINTTSALYIGQVTGLAELYSGEIDEVRISSIARSEEEIAASAQRRPYGVYTSPLIDFGNYVASWNPLTWIARGVNTGNGETPHSTSGLIAQWNFNNTSGTTATNNGGSCGSSCDGALTSFTTTSSQDQWSSVNATGGTITTSGGYTIHTFTSSGTFTPSFTGSVEYLVVGGGGGGGWRGGGGGGGVLYSSSYSVSSGVDIAVTVGGGGGGTTANSGGLGTNGSNSVFGPSTAIGGGGGGGSNSGGLAGGSGGGGGLNSSQSLLNTGGLGTAGQGNRGGGVVATGAGQSNGGGGGGAGANGSAAASATIGGAGGAGASYSISGTAVTYAGGGGGGGSASGGAGTDGGSAGNTGTAATANRGGGGGGGAVNIASGAGGSGVVIVRYPSKPSGWTSNNRRWGSGALMFDGTDDYVNAGSNISVQNSGDFTVESWFKTSDATNALPIVSYGASGDWLYYFGTFPGLGCKIYQANSGVDYLQVIGSQAVGDGSWHYGACTVSGNTVTLYLDGKVVATDSTPAGTRDVSSAGTLTIGKFTYSPNLFYNGLLDSTRIYSRVLTQDEILSNYQSSNIEFQTRVGDTITPEDGTWEEWRPITSETQLVSFDTSLTDSLISYWKMDETSGTAIDSWGINNLTDNNTVGTGTLGTGKTNSSRDFESGLFEFFEINDNTSLSTGDIDFTISGWFNMESETAGSVATVLAGKSESGASREYIVYYTGTTADTFAIALYNSSGTVVCSRDASSLGSVSTGTWYHIVAWHDSSANTCNIQVNNGPVDTASETDVPSDTTAKFRIGAHLTGGSNFYDGLADEIGFWKRILTSEERAFLYSSGSPKFYPDGTDTTNLKTNGGLSVSSDSIMKVEGLASQKIKTGNLDVDGYTAGLWHLDETGGTGAYLMDSSPNANHATPTNTTVADGVSGKARVFGGASHVLTIADSAPLKPSAITLEFWVKTTMVTDGHILYKYNGVTPFQGYGMQVFGSTQQGKAGCWVGGTAWTIGSVAVNDGKWHHVACTYGGSTVTVYTDGVAGIPTAQTAVLSYATPLLIANGLTGVQVDEIRISNVVRSQDEILESYRMGRDHTISKTISSTDLSGKTTLPFYFAADKPGTYMEAIIGESQYANGLADDNTVGMWSFDDVTPPRQYMFPGTTIITSDWGETDTSSKFTQNNGLVLATVGTQAWDSALISDQTYARQGGLKLHFTTTTGATVTAPNHFMVGWGTTANVASYTNISHALYFNSGTFSIYQDGAQQNGNVGTYVANTTYEVEIILNSAGTNAMYYIKGGVYTDWTLIYTDTVAKSNTPVRVQISTHSGAGTIGEITVTPRSTYKDLSGNGNTATGYGVGFENGKVGKAAVFNGLVGSWINAPNFPSLQVTGALTVEAWVKTTSSATYRGIVSKMGTGNTQFGYLLRMNLSGAAEFGVSSTGTNYQNIVGNTLINDGRWHHIVGVYVPSTSLKIYVDGVLQASNTSSILSSIFNTQGTLSIGSSYTVPAEHIGGSIDEVRISNVARTADQIRQAYEANLRTHKITADFGASLTSNYITNSSDLGFTIDATTKGLPLVNSMLFVGDKLIVKENYNGVEYIAQGTVDAIGALFGVSGNGTVSSWDAGSTFPPSGFSANATLFKWQREYWNIKNKALDSHMDDAMILSLRLTDGSEGRTIWIDDLKSGGYLNNNSGSTITSSIDKQYAQFRAIFSSYDADKTATLSSITISSNVYRPSPPTGLTGTALSSTSIRWDFTDVSNNEDNFKLFDNSGNLISTNPSNISSITETGLTPNTGYFRKVAASNNYGNSIFTSIANTYTLANVPAVPTVNRSLTSATLVINENSNSATTTYAIYQETSSTCDGSGGNYLAANGTNNGSTAVWRTASSWSTLNIPSLDAETNYVFCVKAKNTSNIETAFSGVSQSTGNIVPISGDLTINLPTNQSTQFLSRYKDGSNSSRYIVGLDTVGAGNANSSQLNLDGGSVVINSDETLVAGKIVLNGGSMFLATSGARIAPGAKLWAIDRDADGYPDQLGGEVKLWYSLGSTPTSTISASYFRRKALLSTLKNADCDDNSYSTVNTCCTDFNYYVDADGDGFGVGSAIPICRVTQSPAPSGYALVNTDCNDTGTNSNLVWQSNTCYVDADSDTYGAGTAQTCTNHATCTSATSYSLGNGTASSTVAAGGLRTTNTDCGPATATAYPGSATCGASSFTHVAGGNSLDYDCSGGIATNSPAAAVKCGTIYTNSASPTFVGGSVGLGSCNNNNDRCAASNRNVFVAQTSTCGVLAATCTGTSLVGTECGDCGSTTGGFNACTSISSGIQTCK